MTALLDRPARTALRPPRMEGINLAKARQTFAARLKQLREAAGLTQHQLAEKARLHYMSVSRLERGVRDPSWETVQLLAEALGTTCTAFEGTVAGRPPAAPAMGRPKKGEPAPEGDQGEDDGKRRKGK